MAPGRAFTLAEMGENFAKVHSARARVEKGIECNKIHFFSKDKLQEFDQAPPMASRTVSSRPPQTYHPVSKKAA